MRLSLANTRMLAACTWALSIALAGISPARADDVPETPAAEASEGAAPSTRPAGHSAHGEAFDEGPRQAAHLMAGMARIRFPVTTSAPDAQRFFEQGVAQLHGFWYFEAERSFRQAAMLDPNCAMAYWGMAMANYGNEKRAKSFVAKATELKAKASPREAMWIDGLNEYLNGSEKDEAKRRRKHIRSLETIVQDFPDDVEAKAFLAWRIWDSRDKLPISSLQAVDALLDQVFLADPMHPAHHYRIHLWDDDKPARALASAARLGQTSPGLAHMWHMPGHTFSKLHRYEDAAYHQEASARVDHAHMIEDRVMPYQIHNFAHNNEWCVRNLVYVGRAGDGVSLAKNMIELPRHPKLNAAGNAGSAAAMGRDRLMDVLVQHEMWDQLIALADTTYLTDADESPEWKVRRLRQVGVACAATGDATGADEQITALEEMGEQPTTRPTTAPTTSPATQGAADLASAPTALKSAAAGLRKRIGGIASGARAGKLAGPIEKAIQHIRAAKAAKARNAKEALALFEKAGDLSKEKMSQAYLAAGNRDRALQLAREAVDAAKDQCYPLANQVDVLFRSDKTAEAADALCALRKLSAQIDLNAPPYARLAGAAQKLGFTADWRQPHPLPADVLPRPALDALGPFRWHPSPAAAWSLPTADDKQLTLAEFHGRPVLVVFYLGYGCLHCIEQLHAFEPLAKEFASAGISIVAVSSDSPAGLRKSLQTASGPDGYPFPLVSDEGLGTFKAYRAYDDFERTPLHGTFLIDGDGNVRWQDVGFQPFTDAKFLLAESKRLLAQPPVKIAGED